MGVGISLALTGIGTALSAIGSYNQAKAQQAQLNYQADVAEYNADIAKNNAQMATEEGRLEAKEGHENKLKKRQETAQLISKQRSDMSASGALLDTGSLLDLTLSTAEQGEQDALMLEQQGFDNQYKYDVEAQNYNNQADSYIAQSDAYSNQADSVSPWGAVGSTLLSGAIQAGTNYYSMTKGASPTVNNVSSQSLTNTDVFKPLSPNII